MRRTLVVAAVLIAPAVVHADSFLEILGGISIPIADNNWTNTAESSPKLEARAGAMSTGELLGGMLQFDWTPVNLDNSGGSFGGLGSTSIAAHRFRILGDLTFHKEVAPKLMALGRVGAGIDIIHASASGNLLGAQFSSADTDTNFAFELGGGVYYNIGGAQIGGELALPIGNHSKNGNNTDGNYHFAWTAYDLDLLLAVRFTSR